MYYHSYFFFFFVFIENIDQYINVRDGNNKKEIVIIPFSMQTTSCALFVKHSFYTPGIGHPFLQVEIIQS